MKNAVNLMNASIKKIIVFLALLSLVVVGAVLFNQKVVMPDMKKTLPMIIFENKDKIWEVVTYDDDSITAMVITVYPKYEQSYKKVYLNYTSQFVFSDGQPILLHNEPIFWNRRGDVVDYNYNNISESRVFYVNGKGMAPHTAMTLKNLKTNLRSTVLKEKDKIRARQNHNINQNSNK